MRRSHAVILRTNELVPDQQEREKEKVHVFLPESENNNTPLFSNGEKKHDRCTRMEKSEMNGSYL